MFIVNSDARKKGRSIKRSRDKSREISPSQSCDTRPRCVRAMRSANSELCSGDEVRGNVPRHSEIKVQLEMTKLMLIKLKKHQIPRIIFT